MMITHWGRVMTIVVAGLLLTATGTRAMYTPNPAGRWEAQRFFLAGDFQFIADKDLQDGGSLDDIYGFYVRPAYSVARNVVIYGRLGVQGADHVDAGVAVGVGVQGAWVIPAAPDWAIGGSFDYLYWGGDLDGGGNIDWNEFQLTPAVSYNIPRLRELTPYAGMLIDFVAGRDSLREENPVGVLIGANFNPTPQVRLDAQFRGVTETGLFLSAGYLF